MAYPFVNWPGADGLIEASMHAQWFGPRPVVNSLGPPVGPTEAMKAEAWLRAVVGSWPAAGREVALRTFAAYGLPDEIRTDRVVWHPRGTWPGAIARPASSFQ